MAALIIRAHLEAIAFDPAPVRAELQRIADALTCAAQAMEESS